MASVLPMLYYRSTCVLRVPSAEMGFFFSFPPHTNSCHPTVLKQCTTHIRHYFSSSSFSGVGFFFGLPGFFLGLGGGSGLGVFFFSFSFFSHDAGAV